jgi:hypothetical protein
VLRCVSSGLTTWASVSEFHPQLLEVLLYATLKFEAAQVVVMKDLVRQRQDIVVRCGPQCACVPRGCDNSRCVHCCW